MSCWCCASCLSDVRQGETPHPRHVLYLHVCACVSNLTNTLPKCYYLTERYLWFWTLALNCRDNILKWNTARSPNKLHVSTLKVPRSRERPRDRRCCRHLVVHPHIYRAPTAPHTFYFNIFQKLLIIFHLNILECFYSWMEQVSAFIPIVHCQLHDHTVNSQHWFKI